MRSLLGHLGKESFHTFRGFKPPLVCPLVGKKKEAGCTREEGCIARMTKEDRPKTSGFAQVMPLCKFDRYRRSQILFSRLVPTLMQPRPASTSLPGLLEGRPRSAIVSFFALNSGPNTLGYVRDRKNFFQSFQNFFQSSRLAHIPHFTSQDLAKNTSLGRGLLVLRIKIPFGIHLLGPSGGRKTIALIFFPL